MTLGISILLSLVVFLLLVSKILPPTSLVLPLIAKYLLFTFIMNTVSILVTVIIINWNFRGPRTHSMPNWIRVVFIKYLPIFLFMRRPKKTRLRWASGSNQSEHSMKGPRPMRMFAGGWWRCRAVIPPQHVVFPRPRAATTPQRGGGCRGGEEKIFQLENIWATKIFQYAGRTLLSAAPRTAQTPLPWS